jgi:hypothetical protein
MMHKFLAPILPIKASSLELNIPDTLVFNDYSGVQNFYLKTVNEEERSFIDRRALIDVSFEEITGSFINAVTGNGMESDVVAVLKTLTKCEYGRR